MEKVSEISTQFWQLSRLPLSSIIAFLLTGLKQYSELTIKLSQSTLYFSGEASENHQN